MTLTSMAMAPPCPRSGRVACAQSPTPVRHPSNQGCPDCTFLHHAQDDTCACPQGVHAIWHEIIAKILSHSSYLIAGILITASVASNGFGL